MYAPRNQLICMVLYVIRLCYCPAEAHGGCMGWSVIRWLGKWAGGLFRAFCMWVAVLSWFFVLQ